MPTAGEYEKIFDSDEERFGGSGYNRQSSAHADEHGIHEFACRLRLNLPPLGALFYRLTG